MTDETIPPLESPEVFPESPTEPSPPPPSPEDRAIDAMYSVPVQVSVVLGRAILPVNQLLKLGRGAVLELDRKVGEAVDIYVNDRLVARGEVVIVDDRLGITMTEMIKTDLKKF